MKAMCISPQLFRNAILISVIVILSACTSVPNDLGREKVALLVKERGIELPLDAVDGQSDLMYRQMTARQAISLALANNPNLQARYAELGFPAADLYDAGRVRNPIFGAALLDSDESGLDDQLTLSLVASFTDLLTLPARTRMASAEFAAAKEEFALAVLDLARSTQSAYYNYIAAKQNTVLQKQIEKTASLSLSLAERFYDAGNLSPKEIALERSSAAEAKLQALRAEAAEVAVRTDLATHLGLSASGPWNVFDELPLPPQQSDQIETLLSLARQQRLDFSAAKIRGDYLADKLNVTKWERWLGDLAIWRLVTNVSVRPMEKC